MKGSILNLNETFSQMEPKCLNNDQKKSSLFQNKTLSLMDNQASEVQKSQHTLWPGGSEPGLGGWAGHLI